MIATPASASACARLLEGSLVELPEGPGVGDDHAFLEPGRGGAGGDRLELGGANFPAIVQVDVDRSTVPLGEAEDGVELAVEVGVDADRVDRRRRRRHRREAPRRAARPRRARRRRRSVETPRAGYPGGGATSSRSRTSVLRLQQADLLCRHRRQRMRPVPKATACSTSRRAPLCDRRLDLAPDRLLRLDPLGHAAPAAVRNPGGAEERLVEVHVALDEGGQKERAAEVHLLLRLGRLARRADRRDPTALAQHVGLPTAGKAGVPQASLPHVSPSGLTASSSRIAVMAAPGPPYNRARRAKEDAPWWS